MFKVYFLALVRFTSRFSSGTNFHVSFVVHLNIVSV